MVCKMALSRYTVTDVTPFSTYQVKHFKHQLQRNLHRSCKQKSHSAHLPFSDKHDRMTSENIEFGGYLWNLLTER